MEWNFDRTSSHLAQSSPNRSDFPEISLYLHQSCQKLQKIRTPTLYQYRSSLLAPQVRLELTTLRLTAECSAIELLRIIQGLWRDSFGCPAVCCQLPALLRLALAHAPASHIASARRPVLPYVWEREKLSFLPLLLDPGNFLLSQAVPSSVPSAFGGLTSVFGMGTGGALQLSSPETFRREASLSLPTPRTFKTAQQSS